MVFFLSRDCQRFKGAEFERGVARVVEGEVEVEQLAREVFKRQAELLLAGLPFDGKWDDVVLGAESEDFLADEFRNIYRSYK